MPVIRCLIAICVMGGQELIGRHLTLATCLQSAFDNQGFFPAIRHFKRYICHRIFRWPQFTEKEAIPVFVTPCQLFKPSRHQILNSSTHFDVEKIKLKLYLLAADAPENCLIVPEYG